jgi:hypothetical protein
VSLHLALPRLFFIQSLGEQAGAQRSSQNRIHLASFPSERMASHASFASEEPSPFGWVLGKKGLLTYFQGGKVDGFHLAFLGNSEYSLHGAAPFFVGRGFLVQTHFTTKESLRQFSTEYGTLSGCIPGKNNEQFVQQKIILSCVVRGGSPQIYI